VVNLATQIAERKNTYALTEGGASIISLIFTRSKQYGIRRTVLDVHGYGPIRGGRDGRGGIEVCGDGNAATRLRGARALDVAPLRRALDTESDAKKKRGGGEIILYLLQQEKRKRN
jgi:hypothetical protein